MRRVKIGAVSFRRGLEGWESPATMQENIDQALEWIDTAGREGCDVLCLPEAFNVVGTSAMFSSGVGDPQAILGALEEIPGPLSEAVSAKARQHNMYVIPVYLVRENGHIFNRASIFDRQGRFVGAYDKFNPTDYELEKWGVTAGTELPVFELDFGRVAIMICYDMFFPEMMRIYAFKGAEVVFLSTGNITPNPRLVYEQLRVRASDYSVPIAMSNFAIVPPYAPHVGRVLPSRACIVDHDGIVVADTGHRPGLATATLDLDARRLGTVEDAIRPLQPMKEGLEAFVKLEEYAREYLALARTQAKRYRGPSDRP
ncbi:MAG TPA: carbon-nitrogen hydrolase family protein [Anaerolineae bacterium]|nr:carbon-nitrogen hydrolase family protein [Anaerolineae bacterium]